MAGISAIILRKKGQVDKLHVLNTAGTDITLAETDFNWIAYGEDFFPEIKVLLNRIELHKYQTQGLIELEKLLRKTRLVFLKVEHLSDSWIKKIRKVHLNGKIAKEHSIPGIEKEVAPVLAAAGSETSSSQESISHVFLKNEEDRLIMEIAKNPKDDRLYAELGDLYAEMHNWQDSKESYEASIELNPQNESLKQKLSSVLEKLTSQN